LDFVKVKNTFYILQGKKLLVISAREWTASALSFLQ
jgi:hypothetical protein